MWIQLHGPFVRGVWMPKTNFYAFCMEIVKYLYALIKTNSELTRLFLKIGRNLRKKAGSRIMTFPMAFRCDWLLVSDKGTLL